MSNSFIPDSKVAAQKLNQQPKASPSGATDKTVEREKKFDEEGGDQPQAPSQQAVEAELDQVHRLESDSGPRSMGSEGRPHPTTGQRDTPENFKPK